MVKQNGHGYTSWYWGTCPPPLWDGVGWCMVGLVCGYDRLSSAEFGHVVVCRSNFHVRSSCITLYLSTSHRPHNHQHSRGGDIMGWGGGAVKAESWDIYIYIYIYIYMCIMKHHFEGTHCPWNLSREPSTVRPSISNTRCPVCT